MDIRFQIFEEDHLLIQKFSGLFSFEKYMSYNGFINKYLSTKSINKIIIDFRDLLFSEDIDDLPPEFNERIEKIVDNRKSINSTVHANKNFKAVIWVDKPLPTAVAHLFVENFSAANYDYCSTALTAVEILKIPNFADILESTVKNLENTFERS